MKSQFLLVSLTFAGAAVAGGRLNDDGCPLALQGDASTGVLESLTVKGDPSGMNWVQRTSGEGALKWMDVGHGWGTGTFKADGVQAAWTNAVSRPVASVEVRRTRTPNGNGFVECYEWTNVSDKPVRLTKIDIHTPFHDDYLPAKEFPTKRCHAHVWPGGSSAWVCAMRMGGAAPHLGLVVTEGRVDAYGLKLRGPDFGSSNFRGVIALSPPDVTLAPGESTTVAWQVFAHQGKGDFLKQVRRFGGVTASAADWVVTEKEPATVVFESQDPALLKDAVVTADGAKIEATCADGRLVARCSYVRDGEVRVVCRYGNGRETHAELLARRSPEALLAARANFLIDRQQITAPGEKQDGAFVEYDNETDKTYCRWRVAKDKRLGMDHSEGGERLGMGVFLARYAQRHPEPRLLAALRRYARFVREVLQEPDYTTWGEAEHVSRHRLYNYPWVADFYTELYKATGEKRYILDAYGTQMKCYPQIGSLILVESPEYETVRCLRAAGCAAEAERLLAVYKAHKDGILKGGTRFDEVNFAPEWAGSAIAQFLAVAKLTGETKYLDYAIANFLPFLEACMGPQPSWHSHDIGLHHWDGYWFGKRECWGDTLPHDWNGTGAEAFAALAEATGDARYKARARAIVRQLLGLFDLDGRAGCAWVLPDRVNGKPARFRDPLANDQDWSLVFYLRQEWDSFGLVGGAGLW